MAERTVTSPSIEEPDPRMSARELVGDPSADVPTEVRDLLPPYLDLASAFGSKWAETAVTQKPLPWAQDHAERVLSAAVESFDDMVSRELSALPEVITAAMHKQNFIAFSERMDALALASNVPLPSSLAH